SDLFRQAEIPRPKPGNFTVYFLCTLIAKKRKKLAINAKYKKPENLHKQRKNPHFCGFFFGGDGGI
ncbi:MAG TPA: hypothetical protein DCP22_03660, partial [Ruminococcaceae bacterium]|nr:hypothetical protein [Oscillospiraceae bacterium]